MTKEIKISIRNLVEFIMRHGDIDNRFISNIKAIEGIRGHQKIQQSYKENYEAEVTIKHSFEYEEMKISV
ncbi:MAG: hypothetical protein ACRDD7_10630, partial [Peptostreptococcaceae bacterium]